MHLHFHLSRQQVKQRVKQGPRKTPITVLLTFSPSAETTRQFPLPCVGLSQAQNNAEGVSQFRNLYSSSLSSKSWPPDQMEPTPCSDINCFVTSNLQKKMNKFYYCLFKSILAVIPQRHKITRSCQGGIRSRGIYSSLFYLKLL